MSNKRKDVSSPFDAVVTGSIRTRRLAYVFDAIPAIPMELVRLVCGYVDFEAMTHAYLLPLVKLLGATEEELRCQLASNQKALAAVDIIQRVFDAVPHAVRVRWQPDIRTVLDDIEQRVSYSSSFTRPTEDQSAAVSRQLAQLNVVHTAAVSFLKVAAFLGLTTEEFRLFGACCGLSNAIIIHTAPSNTDPDDVRIVIKFGTVMASFIRGRPMTLGVNGWPEMNKFIDSHAVNESAALRMYASALDRTRFNQLQFSELNCMIRNGQSISSDYFSGETNLAVLNHMLHDGQSFEKYIVLRCLVSLYLTNDSAYDNVRLPEWEAHGVYLNS